MKTWKMNDKEFAAVLSSPAERRYEYFIKRVADWRQIWGLRGTDGWVVSGDKEERIVFPVWPHPRFAQACATNGWSGTTPQPISLVEWYNEWVEDMDADGWLVGVFPDLDLKGVVVSPERLTEDLLEELSKYEDYDYFLRKITSYVRYRDLRRTSGDGDIGP